SITVEDYSPAKKNLGIYLDTKVKPAPGINFDPGLGIRRRDPLVFDLNHDGQINTTGLADSDVFFDLDGDGFAEKVGWVSADDGILAFDRNGNGFIENIDEVFGSTGIDGFTELAQIADANKDGVIDANDPLFSQLQVW